MRLNGTDYFTRKIHMADKTVNLPLVIAEMDNDELQTTAGNTSALAPITKLGNAIVSVATKGKTDALLE